MKYNHFDHFSISLIVTALLAPFFEEFAKSFPLFYRHGESEKSLFKLGFLTGLGFGVVEFFLYVFIHHVAFWIRLPGVLFHATNTSVVAYGIGRNRALIFYLIAVLLHAVNNLTAEFGLLWYIFGILAIVISYSLSFYFSRVATDKTIGFWT